MIDPVWIGHPIGIKFNDEDRWGVCHGWPYGIWEVTEPGMVSREMWERIQDYQTPVDVKPTLEEREFLSRHFERSEETAIGREVKRKLCLPGYGRCTTIWEMNVDLDDYGVDYMRLCSFMGETTLIEWSRLDRLFRLPLLRATAKHLNDVARIAEKQHPEPKVLR